MARPGTENYTVRRPDYIPEGEEHLYPHLGGVFHDYVPEGKEALTMHGLTDDADKPEVEDGFAEAKRLAGEPKAKK